MAQSERKAFSDCDVRKLAVKAHYRATHNRISYSSPPSNVNRKPIGQVSERISAGYSISRGPIMLLE